MPNEIVLKPLPGHDWRDEALMDALATPLLAVGFVDVGAFAAPPIRKLTLRLLVDNSAGILAAIFEHQVTGHWLELSSYFLDGGSIVYGTSPTPPYPREGNLRVNVNGLSPGALLTRFMHDRPNELLRPTNAQTAVSVFVDAFADEEAWRKTHGLLPVAFARTTFAPYRKREPSVLSSVMNVVPGLNRRKRHEGVAADDALDRAVPEADERPGEPVHTRAIIDGTVTETRTPWEILGVKRNATRKELRAGYLARCKEYHPDRVAALGARVREVADAEIRAVTAAYEKLNRSTQR